MITDLLKAGFPCVLLQTLEPHRTEDELTKITGWQIARWDCLQGIRGLTPQTFSHEDLQNPIEPLQWLKSVKDTVLIAHGMSNFVDDPMVSQAILNAIPVWKGFGVSIQSPLCQLPLPAGGREKRSADRSPRSCLDKSYNSCDLPLAEDAPCFCPIASRS